MTINYKFRNVDVLADFIRYCHYNPELRFWQALCNWSGYHGIEAVTRMPAANGIDLKEERFDTFNWEGRRGDDAPK